MNANMKYGGAKISSLQPGFSRLNLEGQYTHYKVYMESGTDYQLQADGKYAGIVYPRAMQVTFDESEGTSKRIEGHSSGGAGAGIIRANLSYGSLKIID